MSIHFFFYGTLLAEFAPSHMSTILAELDPVGEGSASGTLYDLGAYPGAVFHPASTSRVHGFIYSAPDDPRLLASLDRYEGYDPASHSSCEYVRALHPITLPSGEVLDCWVYGYNRETAGLPIISGGRYHCPREGTD